LGGRSRDFAELDDARRRANARAERELQHGHGVGAAGVVFTGGRSDRTN
jgi:hypothetical protein